MRVTREDLLRWAGSDGAGHDLPLLVRRLISETCEGVERVHFPAGVGASSGDWDGIVKTTVGDAFVPEGLSGWELSVSKSAQQKAEEDYAKRITAPDGVLTSEATYVQVICRPWIKAKSFAATHGAEGRWRGVRAYNVDDLETWLERAPSTTIWFGERIGRPIAGIQTSDAWWSDWLASTRVPLHAGVVLAGRDTQVAQLRDRIRSPGVTTIGGDVRIEEVRAFVAAAVAHEDADGEEALPVALFLRHRDQTKQLLTQPGAVVALVGGPEFVRDLSMSDSHHVIVPVLGSTGADIALSSLNSSLVTEALEAAGLPWRESADLGELGCRSLLSLRRRLAVSPLLHRPAWAEAGADALQRRTLLLGTWNQASPGDREVVSDLIGRPYQDVEDELRTLASASDDPMVAIVDETWHVISPVDAWMLLGSQLTRSDLDEFRKVALSVLLEPDPVLALPVAERWRASFHGTRRRYSGDLTRGLAKSLALLATTDVVSVGQGQTGGSVAAVMVRELMDAANSEATSRTWITLAPNLSLLGEAAPRVVLAALQRALTDHPSLGTDIFADRERTDWGAPHPSPHTHFLWALETLAWAPEHFDQSVSVLAMLAELDPGGEWANRPIESLKGIFCAWHPNTSASASQRRATLDRLRRRHPAVAWDLLVSMLPGSKAHQVIPRGPEYRDWKAGDAGVTPAEHVHVVDAVASALLEDVEQDPLRWATLIKELDRLPPEQRVEARERLREMSSGQAFGESEEIVWRPLRDFVSHHREYSDAKWALPREEVNELDGVADLLAPTDARRRHAWLFEDEWITLGDAQRRDDYQVYDQAVAERRRDAVAAVLSEEGIDGVVALATDAGAPRHVGGALARATGDEFDGSLLPMLEADVAALVDFSFGFFRQRFLDDGWPWLDPLVAGAGGHSPVVLARLLRTTWCPMEAGERADALGDDAAMEFWKHVGYLGLGPDFPHALDLARRLLQAGRGAAALHLLALYCRRQQVTVEHAQAIARAFEALASQPEDPELGHLSQHVIEKLLAVVADHREAIGRERVIQIEWSLLPALGYSPDARTLHRALAEDPALFVEVLSMAYESANSQEGERPATEQERLAAERAVSLLSSWSVCPGSDESGAVDATKLREWVAEARRLLAEAGLGDVGDEHIGQALASASADEDGTWPCEAVCDLLEELRNDNVERGFGIRVYNRRGVVTKALDAGGRQEWDLAGDYRSHVSQVIDRWPRAAAILNGLADTYEAEARREDLRAERHRRGLGY